MGNPNILQRRQRRQDLLSDTDNLTDFQPMFVIAPLTEELLKVLLCFFHDDIGVFPFVILVPLHLSHEIPIILDYPATLRSKVFHVRNLFQKVLILVVSFDLDLLQGVVLVLDEDIVDIGVASPQFLLDLDLLKPVVALQDLVIGKETEHSY